VSVNAALRLPRWTPLLALTLLAALGGSRAPALLDSVARFGSHIPQTDMPGDYLIAWGLGLGIWGSILFWPVREQDRRGLLILWGAKLGVALGFMLLYERNYSVLDAYSYFRSASAGDVVVYDGPAGTQRMMELVRVLPDPIRSSYHALKVTFALIGLLGVYVFYRAAVLASGRERPRLLLVLGIFPSILFWSTILGKDPIMLLGVGLYTLGTVHWVRRHHLLGAGLVLAGLAVALAIRFWMVPIMLLPLLPLMVPEGAPRVARFGVVAAGLAAIVLLARSFARELQLAGLDDLLSAASTLSSGFAEGGSAQQLPFDITSPAGFAAFLPLGAFTALFRPLPFEAHNLFAMLAGVESALLLTLLVVALARIRRLGLRDPVVRWAASFVVIWSAVYAILSYQNLGTAVRFRLQILPILLLLLLHLATSRKLQGGNEHAEPT
jgi:hypothetical protein